MGARRRFEIVDEGFDRAAERGGDQEERIARLVALGQALSDPIRVRMLGMMGRAAVAATCRTSAYPRARTRTPASASASSRTISAWGSPGSPTTCAS